MRKHGGKAFIKGQRSFALHLTILCSKDQGFLNYIITSAMAYLYVYKYLQGLTHLCVSLNKGAFMFGHSLH